MSTPRVVAIMPVYNEAPHLPRVLDSIAAQDFDRERLFFVAVDGGSGDGSRQILKTWFARSGVAGCVADNARRKIPAALNAGLRYADEDDLVVRLDAHTIYGPTYISDAVRSLETAPGRTGCVGCAYVPVRACDFGMCIVQALYTNPMGLGGADYRFGDDVRDVENIYLGVWRAEILRRAGGFNEDLEANEDAEMSARIRNMGYRILRVPLPCRFIIKRGPLGTIRQWHRYGYWRAKMLQNNPRAMRPRHVISLGTALLAAGLTLSPLRIVLLPMFLGYAGLVVRYRRAEEAPAVTAASILYFPIVQFAFSAGLLRGFLSAPVGRGRSGVTS